MKCNTCGVNKTEEEFSWKIKDKKRQGKCKECHKEYRKAHYFKNKEKYIKKASLNNTKYKEKNIRNVLTYFEKHPCVDCGETDPIVLEFDHRNPEEKSFTISIHCSEARSWEGILLEIEKCDVRCANCHRRKTAKEFGWLKLRLLGV